MSRIIIVLVNVLRVHRITYPVTSAPLWPKIVSRAIVRNRRYSMQGLDGAYKKGIWRNRNRL